MITVVVSAVCSAQCYRAYSGASARTLQVSYPAAAESSAGNSEICKLYSLEPCDRIDVDRCRMPTTPGNTGNLLEICKASWKNFLMD